MPWNDVANGAADGDVDDVADGAAGGLPVE